MEKALQYEIQRHTETVSGGGELIQETRLWDPDREVTRSMRTKEFAHDYRYFPDPDLLPVVVEEEWIEEIRASLPELPEARKSRFISRHALPEYDAQLLTSRRDVADYFEAALAVHPNAKGISNWIMGDLFRVLKEKRLDTELYISRWPVPPQHLGSLVQLVDGGKISGKIAKSVFDAMLDTGRSPQDIVAEGGLEQVSDSASIEATIETILTSYSKQVADYRAGNEKVFGFLVGQIMRASQGKANPQKVNEILRQKLVQGT